MACRIPIKFTAALTLASILTIATGAWGTTPSDEEVFVLIVTNNRSYERTSPDLQYADDDGARYHSFFSMVAKKENISLLTTFDEPTRRLYPKLAELALTPNQSQLNRAIARTKRLVDKANAKGKKTSFYFVFAGHGHVDGGKGYLELSDGRLGPDDLEKKILGRIKADVVHIVLDSCNSFFVINPRKPGGKRWATPMDMTKGFSKRYPHVGVVLSTNSATEVYEWSEIGSGIFSHEIRSGLSGAADANADSTVSYDEIEAFVATANLGIKNESYLPKVFIRGPWNEGSSSLLNLKQAKGRRLAIGETERRLWIRDEQGVRLADMYKEKGARVNLVLPGSEDKSLYIQEQTVNQAGRVVLHQYVTPVQTSAQVLSMEELSKEIVKVAARGHDMVFQSIFAHPYGPEAYDDYVENRPEDKDTVFGIAPGDQLRMKHYLGMLSRADTQRRRLTGGLTLAIGAAATIAGSMAFGEDAKDTDEYVFGAASITVGGVFLGIGAYQLMSESRGEQTYNTFVRELERSSNREAERIVAKTELLLDEVRKRERRKRMFAATMFYLVGAASIAAGVVLFVQADQDTDEGSAESKTTFGALSTTMGVVDIALGVTMHFLETPVERMLYLYHNDPDLNFYFSVAPTRGGGAMNLSVEF